MDQIINNKFLEEFKRSADNSLNTDQGVNKNTPVSTRPMNKPMIEPLSKQKLNKKRGHFKNPRPQFKGEGEEGEDKKPLNEYLSEPKSFMENMLNGYMSTYLFDAVIGAILLFIVTLNPTMTILSKLISGLHQVHEEKYTIPSSPSTVFIKYEKKLTIKGRLIQLGLFIVLFMIIKLFFVTE